MKELDKSIKQQLIGKTLSNIKLYNINDEYYAFYQESHWVSALSNTLALTPLMKVLILSHRFIWLNH